MYAIEANKEIAQNARKVIAERGLEDVISLPEGFSTGWHYTVVAEIVGSILPPKRGAFATI